MYCTWLYTSAFSPVQMAAEKSELVKEGSTLRSRLVAEKQHAAVLQVGLSLDHVHVSCSL